MGSNEHPARNRVPDPDFGVDQYPHALRFIDPTDDPNPSPNLVLHPGDSLAIGAHADGVVVGYIRLYDRSGVCYGVLDCERDVAGHGWLIRNIRFVADYLTVSDQEGGR